MEIKTKVARGFRNLASLRMVIIIAFEVRNKIDRLLYYYAIPRITSAPVWTTSETRLHAPVLQTSFKQIPFDSDVLQTVQNSFNNLGLPNLIWMLDWNANIYFLALKWMFYVYYKRKN